MENVLTVADEIDAEKRRALILEFLSAIFLFIPIVGEVTGSISALADIGAVLTMIGVMGNVATDIYGMASSKKNQLLLSWTWSSRLSRSAIWPLFPRWPRFAAA